MDLRGIVSSSLFIPEVYKRDREVSVVKPNLPPSCRQYFSDIPIRDEETGGKPNYRDSETIFLREPRESCFLDSV